MAEAGEIPSIAKDGVDDDEDHEKQQQIDDGEALVVAAAVVDENDDEDGSTGSGSVVVAKIVEDEPPPTPNTAKIERDLARKLPPTAVTGGSKKGAPLVIKKEVAEEDITPVKRNITFGIGKSRSKDDDKPTEVQVKIAPSSERRVEKPIKDSAGVTKKNPGEKESKPIGMAKGSPKDKKIPKVKSEEKPPAEVVTTKVKQESKVDPMDIATAPADTAKNDDDTDAEEGEEREVEEGEVSEGEIEDNPAEEMKPPSAVMKPPKEKQERKNEGQTKKETKERREKKALEKASDNKKKEPRSSDDKKKLKSSAKDKETTTTSATPPVKKEANRDEDDDEDGLIKEETDEEGEIKEEPESEGEIKDDTEEEGEVKEAPVKQKVHRDVDMEDALSQSEEGGERDVDMETASNDGDTASLVDESTSRKVEPTYSTRGRASGSNTPVPRGSESTAKGSHAPASAHQSGAKTEQWERSVREALEDLGRGAKDAPPAGVGPGGASFLEALGEEERRTRTRFLPAVDGIHMLRKNEIKGDLALARSIISSNGNVASVASVAAGASMGSSERKKSKKKKHHESGGEGDGMDTDDGGMLSSSEDDPADGARVGNASTLEVEPGDVLMVPSAAFVPPPAATQSIAPPSATNGEKKEDGTPAPVASTGVKGILNNQRNIKSPKVVESVMAFNPPRPPESVGKKKQHRMLRWERRPADVEVDLNNYRKTVDRTRKELHTAEDELERIEATSNHLRRHFLGHLQCMDEESEKMLTEFNSVQQKCVNAADLLTSRTRSRGAGKGSYVMRDVLAVLKARGAELSDKGIQLRSSDSTAKDVSTRFTGMGGVGGSSFSDLNENSVVTPQRIASAWVLPGNKVTTPYGEGVVVKIFQNSALNVKAPPLEETLAKGASNGQSPSKMDVDSPSANATSSSPRSGSPKSGSPKSGNQKSSKGGASKKNNASGPSSEELSSFLGERICVRLPFGIGYFSPAVVTSTETPDALSDVQLARRWGGIIESALSHGGKPDLNGMALPEKLRSGRHQGEAIDGADEGATPMDVEGATNGGATTDPHDTDGTSESMPTGYEKKLLPFASRLLATGTGRGNELFEMNAQKLQKALKPALTDGHGVLGHETNEGVPAIVKDFEEERQQSYILQAKVLQLRNELYRQRRIRTLNDRTFTATKERSTRVESLVAEMRTDLKSLRSRLDEELVELGIDQDRAEAILKSYYLSRDYGEHHEAGEDHKTSPAQKRTRAEAAGDKDKGGDGQKANGAGLTNAEVDRHSKRVKVAAH